MIDFNTTLSILVIFAGFWMFWDGLWSAVTKTNLHSPLGDFVRYVRAAWGVILIYAGAYFYHLFR